MGGLGSGSWRDRSARRCEWMHKIDLAGFGRGSVPTHRSGRLYWSCGGRQTGSISYTVLPHALRLEYQVQRYDEEAWTKMEEEIPFTWTGAGFNGRRRWFRCLTCRRRCRILYGGERFRCRRCHRLTYQSQYDAPHERAVSRTQRVRVKLGGSGSMAEPFPSKPKGMHWQTYWRLRAQDLTALEWWARASMKWIERQRRPGG